DGGNKPLPNQDAVIRNQRVTRSQARSQQKALGSTSFSNSQSAKYISNSKAVTNLDGIEAIQQAEKEQPSQGHHPETAASEQSQPVPLTRQALQLLDSSGRSHPSAAMSSEITEASDGTESSINAYDAAYETALNLRCIFFYEGKPENIPKGVSDIEVAVFAKNEEREPPKGEADLVRYLLTRITGEPDVVSQIMPKCVPLEGLQLSDQVEIATDQLWRRCLALDPDLKPSLTTPKPDLTIGWKSVRFPFMRATKNLGTFQCPVVSTNKLSWPLFTAEVKGDGGSLRVAKLQNLHNAAIMLSNLQELMKAAAKEADFFDKIHVLSLQLTPESIQLSYYWATRSKDGQVSYYGDVLETWSPNNRKAGQYDEARRCIHNAIELVRTNAYGTIYSCMEDVEKLYAPKRLAQIPSPRSMSNQRVRKTPSKKASAAKASSSGKSSLSRVSNI
ncbi:MAG: hypothetical protein Q9164_007732, partial [Protoblastenia rupestris]